MSADIASSPATVPGRRPRRVSFVDTVLWTIRLVAVLVIGLGLLGSVVKFAGGDGPSAEAWRDLIVSGLAQGAMYGLIALGYSMVYGVLGFINFAHGEVFMVGAVIGFFAANALFDVGLWQSNPLLSLFIVLIVAMITSTVVAVLVERVAYRRLRNSPRLIPLITSIGVSFFLQYAVNGLFGDAIRTYPALPPSLTGRVNILGVVRVETRQLLVIVVALVSMFALYQLVNRTKAGRAMRAVAEDKEIAALMGINVDRTIVLTFAVGGAMAGIAGVLYGILFRGVFFFTGFLPGIKAFTAAVLGGIGNIPGAMFGGVLLGTFENVGPLLILDGLGIPGVSQLKDVVAFSALVLMLMFRPSGLLGERLGSEDRA